MTERQKLQARDNLRRKIAEIDRVIHEIALSGTASASLSAGSGSKSYSRIDLGALKSLRADYAARLAAVMSSLGGNPSGIQKVMIVRA